MKADQYCTRKHLFFVYTFRSSIGFPFSRHHIRGCCFTLLKILFVTKSLMHPCALFSNVILVYMCQLFFQQGPSFGDSRLNRSKKIVHDCDCGFGRLTLMAFFHIYSLSSVVGSSAMVMEYHSMSKYKMDVLLGCYWERLIQ